MGKRPESAVPGPSGQSTCHKTIASGEGLALVRPRLELRVEIVASEKFVAMLGSFHVFDRTLGGLCLDDDSENVYKLHPDTPNRSREDLRA
jgi:hypothetical protein